MGFDAKQAAGATPMAGRKPFIPPGISGTLQITKAEYHKGFKGESYIFEFEVLDAKAIDAGASVPTPGSECAYIVKLDNDQYGYSNFMAVIEALNGAKIPGLTEDQKREKLLAGKSVDQVSDEDQTVKGAGIDRLRNAAVGMKIGVKSSSVKTKTGNNFTTLTWTHVAGQTI